MATEAAGIVGASAAGHQEAMEKLEGKGRRGGAVQSIPPLHGSVALRWKLALTSPPPVWVERRAWTPAGPMAVSALTSGMVL